MKNKGFSLIELMITLAIIAILTAIAVPLYSNYTKRSACDAGKTGLMAANSEVNQLFLKYGTYDNSRIKDFFPSSIPVSGDAYFNVTYSDPTATTYSITATATGILNGKGTLSINQKGETKATGALADVWTHGCGAMQ